MLFRSDQRSESLIKKTAFFQISDLFVVVVNFGGVWIDVINEVLGRLIREMRLLGMRMVITRLGMSTMPRSPMVLVSTFFSPDDLVCCIDWFCGCYLFQICAFDYLVANDGTMILESCEINYPVLTNYS